MALHEVTAIKYILFYSPLVRWNTFIRHTAKKILPQILKKKTLDGNNLYFVYGKSRTIHTYSSKHNWELMRLTKIIG